MIITGKQKRLRRVVEYIITLFGWLFLLGFLYNMIRLFKINLNLQFYSLNLVNANAIILFTFITLLISTLTLLWWSSFNKRKYGSLKRRNFPPVTASNEIAQLYSVKEEDIIRYQEDQYVEVN